MRPLLRKASEWRKLNALAAEIQLQQVQLDMGNWRHGTPQKRPGDFPRPFSELREREDSRCQLKSVPFRGRISFFSRLPFEFLSLNFLWSLHGHLRKNAFDARLQGILQKPRHLANVDRWIRRHNVPCPHRLLFLRRRMAKLSTSDGSDWHLFRHHYRYNGTGKSWPPRDGAIILVQIILQRK